MITDDKIKSNVTTKISIGFPVYNGEEFLKKKIDSLLNQNFKDFEIIISDNGSTDGTYDICKEYEKRDNRIKYFRQEENHGAVHNYNFVLQKAKYDYFVWTAADDNLLPGFLEKNLSVLELNNKLVGSMTTQLSYGTIENKFKKINALLKKIGLSFRPYFNYSITEKNYDDRIRIFMKKMPWPLFYGVYRTDSARKSFPNTTMVGFDGIFILNALKYGGINLIDEPLFVAYAEGGQSKGMIYLAKEFNTSKIGKIFPYYPFVSYMSKRLERKTFLKSLDLFLRLIFDGNFLIFIDIMFRLKSKIFRS